MTKDVRSALAGRQVKPGDCPAIDAAVAAQLASQAGDGVKWDFIQWQYVEALQKHITWLSNWILKLRNAVAKHRDMKGDDRCHLDDYELYKSLDEPIPDSACQLERNGILRRGGLNVFFEEL